MVTQFPYNSSILMNSETKLCFFHLFVFAIHFVYIMQKMRDYVLLLVTNYIRNVTCIGRTPFLQKISQISCDLYTSIYGNSSQNFKQQKYLYIKSLLSEVVDLIFSIFMEATWACLLRSIILYWFFHLLPKCCGLCRHRKTSFGKSANT